MQLHPRRLSEFQIHQAWHGPFVGLFKDRMAQVQGEHIMHCWHYGGSTEGDHGYWSEYCCNTSLSLSWCISLGSSWRTSFADLSYSQGEHEQHNSERAELSACSMNRLVHLAIYNGGAHSEISAGTQGEYGQRNAYLGQRISWLTLFPWCQRGRVIWLLLPSSPKGEIVGIMIHMLYLMATHSSQIINYSVEKSSRTYMQRKVYFMQRKVHALLCREKFISCREKKFTHFHVGELTFGPW